jgi:carbamoyl-phosphate synthase large subunit
VIRISVDKVRTGEFLQQHGFLAPGVLTDKDFDSPTFPLFIKPRDGSSSLGAHKIDSPQDLAYYRGLYPGSIVQEFIEGVEYTVDVFADFQGCPRCAVPRRRHEVRGGEVSKSQAVQNLRMMKEHCRLVEALGGCRGMITIQCFLTPKDEIVFIEINPRFGGGVPLSIAAGADSPRWIIEGLLGREPSVAMAGWTDGMLMLRYDRGIFVLPEDLPRQATTEAMTSNRGASEPSRP